jgi:acetyl esterase/lipase
MSDDKRDLLLDEPQVDPELASVLSTTPGLPDTLDEVTLREVREQFRLVPETADPSVRKEDRLLPGPPDSPDVLVRVYRPRRLADRAPWMLSMHGGGFVFGSRTTDDSRFARWCPRFGVVGVSVEYRLAPETPFPGPLEDCYAALAGVVARAEEFGVHPRRFGLVGASAGGGLAAGLALLCRDRGEFAPAFQLLLYPMLDDRPRAPRAGWRAPVWTSEHNEFGWRSYLGADYGSDSVSHLAAPARASSLRRLPRTLVAVGGADAFHDEDVAFAARLGQAGVSVDLHVYPGATHGFDRLAPDAAISRRCRQDVEAWLGAVLREDARNEKART